VRLARCLGVTVAEPVEGGMLSCFANLPGKRPGDLAEARQRRGEDRTLRQPRRRAGGDGNPHRRSVYGWGHRASGRNRLPHRYAESMSRLDRITTDPDICHGQPSIRGLRYPVESLLELLAAGMTIEQVITDHPDLERDDLLAALEFGALAAGGHRVVPLGTASDS